VWPKQLEAPIKVLVVCDHAIIRQSLISLLQKLPVDYPVTLDDCGSNEAMERARRWEAELILVESTSDTSSSLSTIRTISAELPDAYIIMIGVLADESALFEAISAGANGYIAGETTLDILMRTLRGVARGELGLSRIDALRVVKRFRHAAAEPIPPIPASVHDRLTRRELEVFDLVRQGMRSREIAERLTIAESTVYKHICNILKKLQVHSRAQAIYTVDPQSEDASATHQQHRM
jgi:DNA-binding NarL/FixJ family response regulator